MGAAVGERALMGKVEIDDVSMRFPGPRGGAPVEALSRVSLAIEDEGFTTIVGPSGCGKSTLLRMVAGLVTPTSGEIRLDGERVTGPSAERGMVFQSYTLFPWLTVRRNVEFGLALKGRAAAERAAVSARLVEDMGLSGFSEAYPSQLSGGMQQRVAIARALANDPKVLLMDEPFGALDSQTRSMMGELLTRIWEKSHKTVMFITHDIDEAIFLGDRLAIMTRRPGRIKRIVPVDLPRPRTSDMLTSPAFMALKREVLDEIREEILGPAETRAAAE